MLLVPAPASRSWRRRDSAFSMTIVRWNCSRSRFVATSTTCGIGRTASWSTPPLKSTMTIDRSSGWLLRHSETSSVLRSSVLPDPDVPPTSPCGPSRTRSTTIGVSDAVPTTAVVSGERTAHRSTDVRRRRPSVERRRSGRRGGRRRRSRRARRDASAGARRAGERSTRPGRRRPPARSRPPCAAGGGSRTR